MLQRKLRIGYTRAARLVDRMEELDIIGKPDPGSGVRPILDFGDEEETE
jgi:S-DNA-T family DNA segregation ATPase FtsK/SpoIIIE